jgi:hypothetical protein
LSTARQKDAVGHETLVRLLAASGVVVVVQVLVAPACALVVIAISPSSPTATQTVVSGAQETASRLLAAPVGAEAQLEDELGAVSIRAVVPATATQRPNDEQDTPSSPAETAVGALQVSAGAALAVAVTASVAPSARAIAAARRRRQVSLVRLLARVPVCGTTKPVTSGLADRSGASDGAFIRG